MKLLRDTPSRTGRPSPRYSPSWLRISRLCSSVLPNPIPGSTISRARHSRRRSRPARAAGSSNTSRPPLVPRLQLHGRGLALAVHQHHRHAAGASRRGLSGSWRRAEMSLIMRAPAPTAARITAALRVSIETSAPALASPSITGTTRLISSPADTAPAPAGSIPRRRPRCRRLRRAAAARARSPPPARRTARRPRSCPGDVDHTHQQRSAFGRPSGQLGGAPGRAHSCAAAMHLVRAGASARRRGSLPEDFPIDASGPALPPRMR